MTRAMSVAPALVILWSTAAWAQQAAPTAPRVALQQLEEMALSNNPTLRQAQAAVDAARGRARQAGAWPNPIVGYVGDEIAPGEIIQRGAHGFFIDQTIVLGGKLRRNRTVFEREVEQAEAVQEQQRLRILSSVRTLFYHVLTTERRVTVLERLAQLAAEAVGVSRQLYNVGAADRPDVLESNIEARRVQLQLTAARNTLTANRWQLASVVGNRDVVTRPLAGSLEEAIPELERDATVQLLLERSPELRAARVAAERARAVVASARSQTVPDLFLRGGLQYNRERLEVGTSSVGWQGLAEVGLNVPLFNRNQGLVGAARADESRAEAERRRLEFNLESRAAVAFSEYLTALRSSEAYRTEVLPEAEEAYRLYLARYREGAAAYPQVLIAQRTLFDMTTEYLDHLENAWVAGLRLQGLLVGEGLDAPEAVGEPITVEVEIPIGGER